MARFIFAGFLLCLSTVFAHHEQHSLSETETLVSKAKAHVEHMLDLDVPNKDKIPPVVLNETQHLAHELKQLQSSLSKKAEGQDAKVSTAATELGNIAATLENLGTDPKEVNAKYFAAASAVLGQLKHLASIEDAGIKLIVDGATNELAHDVDNYQHSVHALVGSHSGHEHGHHEGGKVHQHGAGSSEESSEEEGHSHSHSHHDHSHH